MDWIEKAWKRGEKTLSEHESKELLRHYGIPVNREKEVHNRDELIGAVGEIGFPLVMKACGSQLRHKTENDLVRLDIRSRAEAEAAYQEILSKTKGVKATVLVQEMIKGPRELVMGLTRDPQFGPCVMFGLGGIFTEVLEDISFRVAPIQKTDALEMMQEIKGHRILESVRGMPAADLDLLSEMLIKIGQIGLQDERIQEIDLNPVILSGARPVAVDALVVLGDRN